jgi:hypothetical protein
MRSFPDNRSHDSTGPDPVGALPALAQEPDFLRYDARWRVSLGSARLRFGPALERSFEVTTQRTRARELRLTISLSVGFYLVTIATDTAGARHWLARHVSALGRDAPVGAVRSLGAPLLGRPRRLCGLAGLNGAAALGDQFEAVIRTAVGLDSCHLSSQTRRHPPA